MIAFTQQTMNSNILGLDSQTILRQTYNISYDNIL